MYLEMKPQQKIIYINDWCIDRGYVSKRQMLIQNLDGSTWQVVKQVEKPKIIICLNSSNDYRLVTLDLPKFKSFKQRDMVFAELQKILMQEVQK